MNHVATETKPILNKRKSNAVGRMKIFTLTILPRTSYIFCQSGALSWMTDREYLCCRRCAGVSSAYEMKYYELIRRSLVVEKNLSLYCNEKRFRNYICVREREWKQVPASSVHSKKVTYMQTPYLLHSLSKEKWTHTHKCQPYLFEINLLSCMASIAANSHTQPSTKNTHQGTDAIICAHACHIWKRVIGDHALSLMAALYRFMLPTLSLVQWPFNIHLFVCNQHTFTDARVRNGNNFPQLPVFVRSCSSILYYAFSHWMRAYIGNTRQYKQSARCLCMRYLNVCNVCVY